MTACALRRRSERSHKGRRRRPRDLPASLAAMASDIRRAIDAVYRIESARLIAGLSRMMRDVGLAEDLAQDALVAALEQWPESGIPDNPGAWLMTTAKRRGIDRKSTRLNSSHSQISYAVFCLKKKNTKLSH